MLNYAKRVVCILVAVQRAASIVIGGRHASSVSRPKADERQNLSPPGDEPCSLQQHAAAEIAHLTKNIAASTNQICSSSLDDGSKWNAHVSLVSTDEPKNNDPRRVVWVSGFPRSSTSTVLSLVSAGQTILDEAEEGPVTFSLFEPCHDGDLISGKNAKTDACNELLWHITRCNFEGVKSLWGWTEPHTTSLHVKKRRFYSARCNLTLQRCGPRRFQDR